MASAPGLPAAFVEIQNPAGLEPELWIARKDPATRG